MRRCIGGLVVAVSFFAAAFRADEPTGDAKVLLGDWVAAEMEEFGKAVPAEPRAAKLPVGVPDVPQCSGNSAYNVDAYGKPAFPLTK